MYGAGVSAGGGGGGEGGGLSPRATGWANYRDIQYNEVAPLVVPANTRALLPNNAGVKDESQIPEDMITFYDAPNRRILGTNGSDFVLTVRIKVRPTSIDASAIKMELEITQMGSPVIIETAQRALPWGLNNEVALNFTFSGYVREAFAQSGAKLYITCDGPLEVYGISYVVKRTHQGV